MTGWTSLREAAARRFDTKQHWRAFVHAPELRAPAIPSAQERRSMSAREREAFDDERLAYIAQFTITTPTMHDIHAACLRLFRMNLLRGPGARRGAVIDGLGGLGKTTIVAQLGREWELKLRQKYKPDIAEEGDFTPVVYVSLPSPATTKTLNEALADFYGVTRQTKFTTDWLARKVKEAAELCCTSVVIVDDIHYLRMRNDSHKEVNDHLKALANSLAATFVYAGIGCESSGLLSEGNGKATASMSQTRRRFVRYPVAPFSVHNDQCKAEWLSFLMGVEQQLVLLKGSDGTLTGLSDYLHARTGGFIGSAIDLLRSAAALAIDTGQEKVSEALLDEVDADYASEEEYGHGHANTARSKAKRVQRVRSNTDRPKGGRQHGQRRQPDRGTDQ